MSLQGLVGAGVSTAVETVRDIALNAAGISPSENQENDRDSNSNRTSLMDTDHSFVSTKQIVDLRNEPEKLKKASPTITALANLAKQSWDQQDQQMRPLTKEQAAKRDALEKQLWKDLGLDPNSSELKFAFGANGSAGIVVSQRGAGAKSSQMIMVDELNKKVRLNVHPMEKEAAVLDLNESPAVLKKTEAQMKQHMETLEKFLEANRKNGIKGLTDEQRKTLVAQSNALKEALMLDPDNSKIQLSQATPDSELVKAGIVKAGDLVLIVEQRDDNGKHLQVIHKDQLNGSLKAAEQTFVEDPRVI